MMKYGCALTLVLAAILTAGCGSNEEPVSKVTRPPELQNVSFLDLEPTKANANDPNDSRNVDARIALAVKDADYTAAKRLLDEKRPQVDNRLLLYFADQPTDRMLGAKNLQRMQAEIAHLINEVLGKPVVQYVLFRRFLVQ